MLKTDRNTFCTFILLLLTIYFLVDRFVEVLMIIFTGISTNYWGPIMYTIALACPIFAFLFSGSSKFVKSDKLKLNFFYIYCIALYMIAVSMVVQWINAAIWIGLLSLPNYSEIAIEFSYLIRPALSSIAIYLPLTTFSHSLNGFMVLLPIRKIFVILLLTILVLIYLTKPLEEVNILVPLPLVPIKNLEHQLKSQKQNVLNPCLS